MVSYVTIFMLLLLLVPSLEHELPKVNTSVGLIKGHHKVSYEGRMYSAFEGIPYAQPPIGDLRFREPLSVQPWSGIWEATIVHTCIQLHKHSSTLGHEDCLYLNVYVPNIKPVPSENLDVIVHIHGGALMEGSPSMAGPEYLMDRNIIYVNLSYRLGVLGFLSTQDEVVSGNNGMKDQIMALKWIQSHIQQFGGNPKSVTITGVSAGGASVDLCYISPLTKGLFHRGISHSATALIPIGIQETPLENAKKLAATIGCDNPSTRELVRCLRERPVSQVIRNSNSLSHFAGFPIGPFVFAIEKKSKSAFLTDYPEKLFVRGNVADVPWMTSVTTEEGIIGLLVLGNELDVLDERWNEALPYILAYTDIVADSDKLAIAQNIKKFYFGDNKVSHNNTDIFIKLYGDRTFNLPFEKSARLRAKLTDSPIYSYIYGYRTDYNFEPFISGDYGINHGNDRFLLYQDETFKNQKLSKFDKRIKDLLLDTVTSFAKNGKPELKGIDWKPVVDSGDFRYLFIHNDEVKMVLEKEIAPTEFWNSLPLRENKNISFKDKL